MKLRNKQSGEIKEFVLFDGKEMQAGLTLENLAQEWEDYEEPKKYYWIDYDGKVKRFEDLYEWQDKMKQIGNYFETKEEAEKAVEKLKAWKRLKDKGFEFNGWIREHKKGSADITIASFIDEDFDITDELYLLFGGNNE